MDVVLFFIFLICDLIIVPICWFSYGNQSEYREGMVMGVHIPAHEVEDPEVTRICGRTQKQWKRFHQISLLLSMLICFLCFYNFTLFIIVWSVWLTGYVAGLYWLIVVPHRQMYRLKLKRGWLDASSMHAVRIDTSVSAFSGKMALDWKWHLPPVLLTSATALLLHNMEQRYRLSSGEMTAEWVMYVSGVFTCLLFLALHVGIVRQANRVYSKNTEINLAANRLMKRAWSQGLVPASWISGGAWIFLAFCGSISGPDLPAGCYGVYAFFLMVSAVALLVPLGLAVGKRKEILDADQAPCYVDDDVYWKYGWYDNPNDRHILVQDRFISMNYSFNFGRPAVKVILGILAAAVAGIVIWTFSLLAAFENVQVLFQEEGEVYRFEAAGYEYEFSGNDIQSVKLIDELPDERFTRTNGGSTEKVNIGHFRGRETGKCMMFLYNDCTPVLEIRLDDMTVFANSRDPQETERWLDMLSE